MILEEKVDPLSSPIYTLRAMVSYVLLKDLWLFKDGTISASYLKKRDFIQQLLDNEIPIVYLTPEDEKRANYFRQALDPNHPEGHIYRDGMRVEPSAVPPKLLADDKRRSLAP